MVFVVIKAQVWTCEIRSHEKKKKIDFPNLLDIEVTSQDLWRKFLKNQNFSFNGPYGTGPDL